MEEARRTARMILKIAPDFSASEWVQHPPIKNAELQSKEFHYLSGVFLGLEPS